LVPPLAPVARQLHLPLWHLGNGAVSVLKSPATNP
jgi:hypothetical protein